MIVVDPITFEVVSSNYNVYGKVKDSLEKSTFKNLKEFNECLLSAIAKINDLPADTRFPGFFSSLADHALLTSTFAVAIALDLNRKGVDFSIEYNGKFSEMLRNEKELVEVVRCASLLHDIGKHPPQEHCIRTEERVEELLKMAGFGEIAKDLAKCASRHHYSLSTKGEYKPETKLEWVIALADKVAVVDRIVMAEKSAEILSPYKWLLENLGEGFKENKKYILELIEFLEGKKEKISEEGIILPINMEDLYKIDRIVFNPKEVFGVEPKIGLLCLEIAGIQNFVTSSDYRRYISGASLLLENLINEIRNYLSSKFCPECVVYAKGGSLLAIVPMSYYGELEKDIREKFKDRTIVVSPKIPPQKFFAYSLAELKYGPQILWESDKKLTFKRNFGSTVSRTLNFLETEKSFSGELKIEIGEICRSCYEFPAEFTLKFFDEELKVCKRCNLVIKEYEISKEKLLFAIDLEKLEVDKGNIENEFWKKLTSRFEERLKSSKIVQELKFKGVKRITFVPVKTWDHLGRQHFSPFGLEKEEIYDIAFLKGDGDNFGKIKEIAPSPTVFRKISMLFEKVIEDSNIEGFVEILLKELQILSALIEDKAEQDSYMLEIPFDIVFIGGDDFLVVMDPAFVFTFLKTFRNHVQKLLGERKEKYEKDPYQPLSIFPLGVSIGVAVVRNRIPIKSIFDALNELTKKAKEKSKKEAQQKRFGSEIYIYMQKFDQIPTEDEIKSFESYTSFPMNGKEFQDFSESLIFFIEKDVSSNWIKRVFDEEKPRSREKAFINFLYKMARAKGKEEYEPFSKLYEIHGKLELREDFRYKHLDLADAIRILTERVNREKRVKIAKILLGD